MVYFGTLPGVITLCIVLANNLVSAAPAFRDDDDDGGIAVLTNPAQVVMGVANPLLTGSGKGITGAAAGTAQTTDLIGDAGADLLHTFGGISGNVEQGTGVAVANVAPAIQGTVYVQSY